jgi:hypothetical protein
MVGRDMCEAKNTESGRNSRRRPSFYTPAKGRARFQLKDQLFLVRADEVIFYSRNNLEKISGISKIARLLSAATLRRNSARVAGSNN